jgi:hypothetical protein
MTGKDQAIATILIILLALLSFMLGVLLGEKEAKCNQLETTTNFLIDETGTIYRVNYRNPDTTQLMQLPRNVDAVKVLH